jgi:hypothetical protein
VNRGLLFTGASGLTLMLIWLGRCAARHQRAAPDNQRSHPSAPSTQTTPRPDTTAPDVGQLLPFSPHQIAEAASLASAFTAAYGTYRHDEEPQHYLRRLEAMISPQLRPRIARTSTDPDTLLQRRRAQENSDAHAHLETIRAITPTSITVVITATQQLTTTHVTRRETTRYTLTLTPSPCGWRVHSIELTASK